MPTVTITIEDSDDKKGLTCESDMDLRPGMPLSLAQIAAAEIMLRTNREWLVNAGKSAHRGTVNFKSTACQSPTPTESL